MGETKGPFDARSRRDVRDLGPLTFHGNGMVTCSLRRIFTLYVLGIAIGVAAGVAFSAIYWVLIHGK